MKTAYWLAHLALSLCIAPLTWLRDRIKDGPSARLWLATDDDILAEARKRGLLKRQAQTGKQDARIDAATQDAIGALTTLNGIPKAKAQDVVVQAAREFAKSGKKAGAQELTILALKMVG